MTGIWCIWGRGRWAAPGLIFTEMTVVAREARITHGCAGTLYRCSTKPPGNGWWNFVHGHTPGQNLHAARSCRPQRRDQADLGRHG